MATAAQSISDCVVIISPRISVLVPKCGDSGSGLCDEKSRDGKTASPVVGGGSIGIRRAASSIATSLRGPMPRNADDIFIRRSRGIQLVGSRA